MNVTVNAIHFTADQKLVDFAVKKTSKLDTFFDGIIARITSYNVCYTKLLRAFLKSSLVLTSPKSL